VFALKHGLRCRWPWLSRGWLLLAGCKLVLLIKDLFSRRSEKNIFFWEKSVACTKPVRERFDNPHHLCCCSAVLLSSAVDSEKKLFF
jgi:hypothetical protein